MYLRLRLNDFCYIVLCHHVGTKYTIKLTIGPIIYFEPIKKQLLTFLLNLFLEEFFIEPCQTHFFLVKLMVLNSNILVYQEILFIIESRLHLWWNTLIGGPKKPHFLFNSNHLFIHEIGIIVVNDTHELTWFFS